MIGDMSWKREKYTYGLMPDVDLDYGKPIRSRIDAHVLSVFSHKTTPILRKLDAMTEEEEIEMNATQEDVKLDGYPEILLRADTGETFAWLCKHGFDLFGLIDAGLAIDSDTLKP